MTENIETWVNLTEEEKEKLKNLTSTDILDEDLGDYPDSMAKELAKGLWG